MNIRFGDLLFALMFAGTVGAALADANDLIKIPATGETYGYGVAISIGILMLGCFALGRFGDRD